MAWENNMQRRHKHFQGILTDGSLSVTCNAALFSHLKEYHVFPILFTSLDATIGH